MRKTGFLLFCAMWASGAEITYTVQTVAGSSQVGDGGSALNAQLSDAQGLAVDRFGAVYVADPDNHRVRKVNGAGVIETLAGTGFAGFSGDGGPAKEARLNAPYGVAVDAAGNVYIADLGNNRVRKITPDGAISTVAGTGLAGSDGDGGPAAAAQLHSPRNVAVDSVGNLYIAEFEGHRIRRVTSDGIIRTIAGTGLVGARGDGGPAIAADLAYPAGMTFDFTGTLYIADSGNRQIRRVFNGVITSVPFTGFTLSLPTGVCSDGVGGLYVADSGNQRVLRRTYLGGVTQIPGSARDVATDGLGELLIADGHRVRLLTGAGYATTLAGDGTFGFRGDGGAATLGVLNGPDGVAVGWEGSLYIADGRNHRVRRVSGDGAIATIAGNGSSVKSPEGLPPTATAVIAPEGLFSDPAGGLWVGERFGARIRRLTTIGTMFTAAGTGTPGFNGDSRPATSAQLQTPGGVALDAEASLYIADTGNNRIRKVALSGTITTFVGTGIAGFSGDGGQGWAAQLDHPRGIAFDATGNLYIADTNNQRIRKVTPGGLITTVAGEGELPLLFPRSVAVDSDQNIYIADTANHRIVKKSATGEESVIAGIGAAGFGGDGGAALVAQFSSPAAITLDSKGNLYVADLDNNRVRKLTPVVNDIPAPVTQAPVTIFLNAATRGEGQVAPGELLSIIGDGIGPEMSTRATLGADGSLPTLLAETRVLFDGRAAPLLAMQPNQIDVQVPYETTGQTGTQVQVYRGGTLRAAVTLTMTSAAPGIFATLTRNFDGSLNSQDNPADPGSEITLFATGEGQTNPGGISGKVAAEPYPKPLGDLVVRVGGRPTEILFAGEAPGMVGVLQVDAIIPTIVDSGAVLLSLAVGSAQSQGGVTVFVK